MKSKERVLLGMSGGTDSSVAAMRLQDAGYEVTGVTFRFYEKDGATEYLDDARALASRLGIEHITYDAREMFRSRIIRYFIDEYLAGHTPVPCTLCNNELKWTLLAKIADEKGIYWISTGHYVRKILQGGKYYMAPAADRDKDQTFFLWGLKQDIIQRMLLLWGTLQRWKHVPLQRLVDFMGWQQRKTVSAYASVRGTIVLFCDVRQVPKNCPIRGNSSMKTVVF